ncbi:MAG: bifunctional diaminohydroxyphosphoribosylaminopyrimidine deaminase/5-amino-6-(5-phosphoribosylamino)uracil reductase RibD [Alphaproteobacteria bacterium]|nr:bifunctional diaminohydroxyphosphoribosylaminopyrimidine deaminase/5-amino-6-(5-phosphoribosylamino)uracil reductase RibD [Alphaproteobacteria bacterium]
MRAALRLARRGLGVVWPNPAVGCVLVKDGLVVGRGWTQPRGRPHAETEALARARGNVRGATAYVTFEPCAHNDRVPSCAVTLATAGIKRAVVACRDPDPRTSGKGIALLKNAGVEVIEGVLEADAKALNAGFLLRVTASRPLVTLKVASSLDGRIATGSGESKWITGEPARAQGHALRARQDAVVVGSGTVLADDPELTCRLPGLEYRSPVRVVFDGRLRTPLTAKIIATARQTPTWIVTLAGADALRQKDFADAGVLIIPVSAGHECHPEPKAAFAALAQRGITRVLVEGGRHLTAALLRDGPIDRIVWYRAPMWLGGDGVPAAESLGLQTLNAAPRFRREGASPAGEDMVETYKAQ